ncbi:MAG: zinc-ribbon domain-containing protein [Promethearchaeota archaeon]
MFCPGCGRELNKNQIFCPDCGMEITIAHQTLKKSNVKSSVPSQKSQFSGKPKKKKSKAGIIIVLILISCFAFFFLTTKY